MKFPFRRKRKPDDDDEDFDESETVEDDSDVDVAAAPDETGDDDEPEVEAVAAEDDADAAEDADAARGEADETESSASGDDGPEDAHEEGEDGDFEATDDEDFDEDFDEDGGAGRPKGLLIGVSAAALLVVVGVFAGAWWFIAGGEPAPEAGERAHSDGTRVIIDVPRRNVAPLRAALTPPERGESGLQPPALATPSTVEDDSDGAVTAASELETPGTAEPEASVAAAESADAADSADAGVGGEADPTAAASPSLNAIVASAPQTGEGVVIASVESAAYAQVPQLESVQALPEAPDSDLVEDGSDGPLPKISGDGRTPWKAYARPFDVSDERARVAVVLVGLGLSRAATEAAIARSPTAVSLAFDVYANDLGE
ncbi:MAG: hypothetical protein QF902_05605 [Rhodospirillales bacterium]|nr:hypothetical protein [Rhodospirillales bacterium]